VRYAEWVPLNRRYVTISYRRELVLDVEYFLRRYVIYHVMSNPLLVDPNLLPPTMHERFRLMNLEDVIDELLEMREFLFNHRALLPDPARRYRDRINAISWVNEILINMHNFSDFRHLLPDI